MDFTVLKDCLDKMVHTYNTPGVDCIVYKNHEMLYRYITGVRDVENNLPSDENTLYTIFSMTKMITCTAALQLLDQNKYKLSDPISLYLPAFERMRISNETIDASTDAKITTGSEMGDSAQKNADEFAKNPITVLDLFRMGGGLDYNLSDEPIRRAIDAGKTTTRELVEAMAQKPLGFEPGTKFRYSLCHDVLGALIEVWSGKRLGEYMKTHIFEPLGMQNTFFGIPKDAERLSKMAARYTYDENRMPKRLPLECVYNLTPEYESGGAGLVSCTADYALFLDALACGGVGKNGNRILKPETVALMGQNHLKGQALEDFSGLRAGYGYGLGVRTHMDKEKSGSMSPIGEFGWDGACGGFSMVDCENALSMTYFQQIHNWELKIQSELRNALYTALSK